MGCVIASYNKKNYSEILEEYSYLFYSTFKKYPSENSFINILEHMFGYFKTKVSLKEKKHFLDI